MVKFAYFSKLHEVTKFSTKLAVKWSKNVPELKKTTREINIRTEVCKYLVIARVKKETKKFET